jgi:hypothetical protein
MVVSVPPNSSSKRGMQRRMSGVFACREDQIFRTRISEIRQRDNVYDAGDAAE